MKNNNIEIIKEYQNILSIDSLIPNWLFIVIGMAILIGSYFSFKFYNFNIPHKIFWLSLFWGFLFSTILTLEILFLTKSRKFTFGLMKQKEISLFILDDVLSTIFNIMFVVFLLLKSGTNYIFPFLFMSYGLFGLIAGAFVQTKINYFSISLFISGMILFFFTAHFHFIGSIILFGLLFLIYGITNPYLKLPQQKDSITDLKDKIILFKTNFPVHSDIGMSYGIGFLLIYIIYYLFSHKLFFTTTKGLIISIVVIALLGVLYEFVSLYKNIKIKKIPLSKEKFISLFTTELYILIFAGLLGLILYKIHSTKFWPFFFNIFISTIFIMYAKIINKHFLWLGILFIFVSGTSLLFKNYVIVLNLLGASFLFFIWAGVVHHNEK